MQQYLSSRSRLQDFQRCNRARYWLHEARGTGFSPRALAVPLVTGGAVHLGLEALALNALDARPLDIDAAVLAAVGEYERQCSGRGFSLEELESQSFVFAEQRALVEGLVRLAGIRVMPKVLESYEILEVEKMDSAPLISDDASEWEILWRSIPDALLRSKADGDLYVLSWKTTAEYSSQRDQDARTDMQGLSECWALEARLAQWEKQVRNGSMQAQGEVPPPDWFVQHIINGGTSRIRGVQMAYLVKGARRKASQELNDRLSTPEQKVVAYKTASPLIYGYAKSSAIGPADLAWSNDWKCSAPHPMRKSQWYPTGECPGDGRNHKRGDDWKSFAAWETIGVKAWVDALATEGITPEAGDALDSMWVLPVPHFRTAAAVASWERQAKALETRIARGLSVARIAEDAQDGEVLAEVLDEHFPQATEKCADWFHRKCPAWELCHGSGHVAEDPVGSGLYQIKTPYEERVGVGG